MSQQQKAATVAPSLILAIHARWERIWEDYAKIDKAQPRKPEVRPDLLPGGRDPEFEAQLNEYFRCKAGLEAMEREADHLRLALLYEVPSTDEELTILSHHIQEAFDYGEGLKEPERLAIREALNSCFDYLICENRAEIDGHGQGFRNSAMWAFHRRRYRTGLTAEEE
jgi:hypothetical protein